MPFKCKFEKRQVKIRLFRKSQTKLMHLSQMAAAKMKNLSYVVEY